MTKRELTCISCPLGCQISVEMEDGNIISVKGNTCPRGERYARQEVLDPRRTVTSTDCTAEPRRAVCCKAALKGAQRSFIRPSMRTGAECCIVRRRKICLKSKPV